MENKIIIKDNFNWFPPSLISGFTISFELLVGLSTGSCWVCCCWFVTSPNGSPCCFWFVSSPPGWPCCCWFDSSSWRCFCGGCNCCSDCLAFSLHGYSPSSFLTHE